MGLKQHAWSICILVALSCAAHWQWLFLPGIFTDGDFWYQPNQVLAEAFTVPKILNITTTLGAGTATPTFAFLFIFGGLLSHIHLYFAAWERIVFLWPIAFLAPLPIYAFLYRMFRYQFAAIVGALLYSLNSYVLSRELSHLNIAIAFLLTPLLIITFEGMVKKQTNRSMLYFMGTSIIYSIYEARILFIAALILVAYGFFLLASKAISPSWKLLRTILIPIALVTLFQSYWLAPFLFSNSSLGYVTITSRGLFPSFAYLTHGITISDPFWVNWGTPSNFISEPVQWWLYLIPIAACLWIVLKKQTEHRKVLWFWFFVAIAGIFLVKATNQPFPDVYPWLFAHVPGFRLFRDSSKFNLASALGITILATASVAALRKKVAPVGIALGVALTLIMLNNAIMLFAGKVPFMTTAYTIANPYITFKNILEADSAFGRSLWFPTEDRFVFMSESHPRLSALYLASEDWSSFVRNPSDPISLYSQPIAHALLNFGSFAYIGAPLDSISNIYIWYPTTKNQFISYIKNIPHLEALPEMSASMPVWKNPDAKPLAYLANNIILAHEDVAHFSGNDASKDSAFIFEPQLSAANLERVGSVITNQEFNPFLPSSIALQEGSATTRQAIPTSQPLTTTIQGDSNAETSDIFARQTEKSIHIFIRNQNQEFPIANIDYSPKRYALVINGKTLEFSIPQDNTDERYIGSIRFPHGSTQIALYKEVDGPPALTDPSFEQGTWGAAGDCNNIDGTGTETNGILATQSTTATQGDHSLELSVGKHIACAQTPLTIPDSTTLVVGSLDYSMETTIPGSMRILDGATGSKEFVSVIFEHAPGWQHTEFSFTPTTEQKLAMYLYQPSDTTSQNPTKGLFDNIELHAYADVATTTFTPPATRENVTRPFTPDDIVIRAPGITDTNLIHDMPLSATSSLQAGDCNNIDHTKAEQNGIKASVTPNKDNTYALTIQASRHIACVSLALSDIDPAYNYLLTTTYKSIQGAAPWISLYPNKDASAVKIQLPQSNGAQSYSSIIEGQYINADAQLYIYVSGENGPSSAQFDAISLKKIPILPQEYISTSNPPLPAVSTTLRTINPETHVLGVDDLGTAPRLLVLSNTFNPGWKLFVRKAYSPDIPWIKRVLWEKPGIELSESNHMTANAFVNGWVVDPQEVQQKLGTTQHIEFVMEYWPQRYMDVGTALTALTTLLLAFYAVLGTREIPERNK